MTRLSAVLLALIALSTQATAAEEHDNVMFRFDEAAPMVPGLRMLGWGPGSVASSPAVMGRLFPPTLIMQRQDELSLTDAQEEAIKAELREFQSQVVDVQWDLQSSQGAFDSLLDQDRVDPGAAAAAIDRVLAAENALKKLHLTMLIRIRNALDPQQIATLQESMHGPRVWMRKLAPPAPPEP